jgi:hypothetical protein
MSSLVLRYRDIGCGRWTVAATRRVVAVSVLGILLSSVSIGGYLLLASSNWATFGKPCSLALFAVGLLVLFFSAAYKLTMRVLILPGSVIALWSTLFVQALAFTRFPGLAKDRRLLSVDNLVACLVIFGLFLVANLGAILLGSLVRYLIRRQYEARG